MNRRIIFSSIAGLLVLAVTGAGAYRLGTQAGAHDADMRAPDTAKTDASGRKVLYWHDPMVPGQKFDKPGKSPFMDMDLVPVYADEGQGKAASRWLPVCSRIWEYASSKSRGAPWPASLDAVGNVAFNERDLVLLQARSNGLRGKAVRARAPRSGSQGPATAPAVRAGLGRGAGGIPGRQAHAGRF
jgi:Cu(I)/Ag(I) efflux system membrane fusion protein